MAGRVPLLDRAVGGIGNIDIARLIHRHAKGHIEWCHGIRGDERGQ